MVSAKYWGLLAACIVGAAHGVNFRREPGVPSEFDLPTWQLARSPSLSQPLSFDVPRWESLAGGKGKFTLPGAKFFSAEGLPQLPVVVRKFALSPGTSPQVFLRDLQIERSEPLPQMEKSAAPYVWGPQELKILTPARGRYYPGKWAEVKVVGAEAWVSIYPVQFDRQSGEVLAARSGSLIVDFVAKPTVYLVPTERGPESLILTSRALEEGARLLQDYHRSILGVHSGILFVESLSREPMLDETNLPSGYKHSDSIKGIRPYDSVSRTGYDYALARRISHYLWNQMAPGKRLRSVTVLGDATKVPPSYYFSIRAAFGPSFGVTDACYGANEGCLSPQLAVGRLPFQSTGEVRNYLRKLNGWYSVDRAEGPELALYGGKAFRGYQYIGELGALRPLSLPSVNWDGVEKHFRTLGNYKKADALRLVGGDQKAKVVYYLDHGRGNEWYVEREFISSREAVAAEPAAGRVNPFLVSISCSNGAFDRSLVDGDIFGPRSSGDESVGMALLKSKAGVVGYLGSARPALGNPVYDLDPSGNLSLTGSTYGMQILDNFLDGYHASTEGRAGEFFLRSLRNYVAGAGNDMTDDSHLWSYLNVVLLGDPVAPMLSRRQFDQANRGARLTNQFVPEGDGAPLPFFRLAQLGKVTLDFSMDAGDGVRATLLRVDRMRDREEVIGATELSPGAATWTRELEGVDAEGIYLMKFENTRGVPVERQAWFGVSTRS